MYSKKIAIKSKNPHCDPPENAIVVKILRRVHNIY